MQCNDGSTSQNIEKSSSSETLALVSKDDQAHNHEGVIRGGIYFA